MTNNIYPPDHLLRKWESLIIDEEQNVDVVLYEAFQAGADQELEACCSQLAYWGVHGYNKLYEARRPKPPSLKEQALEEVGAFEGMGTCNIDIIRRALESLPE
jgi:hypothetical protein